MPVNNLESIINQSLGIATEKNTANSGARSSTADQSQADSKRAASPEPAAQVTLSSRALPRKIVNSYEKVELSSRVPQQIPVETMTRSQNLSNAMLNDSKLGRSDYKELRENRVLAALTGMRILQKQTGDVQKVWLSGIPAPSPAELEEAYRRLTQRLSSPTDMQELMKQNAERVNLLESFRSRDFSGFTATTATSIAEASAGTLAA